MTLCQTCGRPLETDADVRRRYCSPACRQRSYRERREALRAGRLAALREAKALLRAVPDELTVDQRLAALERRVFELEVLADALEAL